MKYHYFRSAYTDSVRRRAVRSLVGLDRDSRERWKARGNHRSAPRTESEREFDWGGTSVKVQRRCPKASSARTET